jgi:polysaccharide pyruvyl transferase WcaK-like protein
MIFEQETTHARTAPAVERAPRRQRRTTGPRIGVLYPSGWGNLGDEAILQATFESLREQWPNAQLRAFTLHPARTSANHAVDAEPLTGLNRPLFGAPRGSQPFLVRAAESLARRTRQIPMIWRMTRWVCEHTSNAMFEIQSVASARWWLKDADLVLASGGGQLDDVWGGAWGQPYALARWAWLSKRAGVPFAFFSVGFGGASSWLSRRFLRYAVETATYCSVRDQGSRTLTEGLGVRRDLRVVPDLAFALAPGTRAGRRRVGYDIGVSPMTYLRPGSWPKPNEKEYQRFVALWVEIVSAIVKEGNRPHLFVSAPEDMAAVTDVWERLGDDVRAESSINQAATPNALLEFYRGMDVVISSRLHGVLLAFVGGTPVVALSHERKVRRLMADAGAGSLCVELDAATPDQTMAMLQALIAELAPRRESLRQFVGQARAAVVEQLALLPQLVRVR